MINLVLWILIGLSGGALFFVVSPRARFALWAEMLPALSGALAGGGVGWLCGIRGAWIQWGGLLCAVAGCAVALLVAHLIAEYRLRR